MGLAAPANKRLHTPIPVRPDENAAENALKQYIVDAFTDRPFSGNPAAVCIMEGWPGDDWMQLLAFENNLSETAFLVREGDVWRLRFFTPSTEVDLCGHATLASAFVIMNCLEEKPDTVGFVTNHERLHVERQGDLYAMDFPRVTQREIPVTQAMAEAFGAMPARAFLGTDLICVFDDEEQICSLRPDQALLAKLDGRGQNATAPGIKVDCATRSFFPKLGIPEDPVCGSAHCQIAPYWCAVLGKDGITAYQASKRGGFLHCKLKGNRRVGIGGKACLVAISGIQAAMPYGRG